MKKLYLLRHGQTLFNLKDMVQGQCDSKLTPLGKRQARAAGDFFQQSGIVFDHVYTSTLGRTEETLQQFYTGPYTRVEALQERSYGVLEGDSNYAIMRIFDEHPESMEALGIESDESLNARMIEALRQIMENEDHRSVLAVIHGDCLWRFAQAVDHEKVGDVPRFGNCVIYEFDFDEDDGTFAFVEAYDDHVRDLK